MGILSVTIGFKFLFFKLNECLVVFGRNAGSYNIYYLRYFEVDSFSNCLCVL